MQRRLLIVGGASALLAPRAFAHHGWSSFDQDRPIWLEGKAVKVAWGNPHVEIDLQIAADLKLPTDLARRALPAQSANVDGPRLLAPALNLTQDLYVSVPLKTGRIMAKDEDVCLHCGLCAERCPTGAWDMQKFLLVMAHAGEIPPPPPQRIAAQLAAD